MNIKGTELFVKALRAEGVDTVFGYPGGTILNVYDALYKHQDEIKHILTSHEQGASHAADGYARATGKVGVCMATSGPGATNLVTGIATAYMDSIPMVAITANVGVSLLGKDSFQEIDIAGVVMPITKHSFIVKNVHELADTIRRAFKIAKSGRPGPVLVDITKDVTANLADYEYKEPEKIAPIVNTIKESDLEKAAKLIAKAKKPFIFLGGGCILSNASKEVSRMQDASVGDVAATVASALLRGARGNSGVILSLLFRGLSRHLKGFPECDGVVWAEALQEGVDAAYKAVMKPAEGTILTVARLAAAKATEAARENNHIEFVHEAALEAAKVALAGTTDMNPVLKKAGVVDAGGKGWLVALEAMMSALRGEDIVVPEGMEDAVQTVLAQCELWTDNSN